MGPRLTTHGRKIEKEGEVKKIIHRIDILFLYNIYLALYEKISTFLYNIY